MLSIKEIGLNDSSCRPLEDQKHPWTNGSSGRCRPLPSEKVTL